MKEGISLNELAQQITQDKERQVDFVVPDKGTRMRFGVHEPKNQFQLYAGEDVRQFTATDLFHAQMSEKLGIPKKYYDRMMEETPALLCENVETWLNRSGSKHLWRSYKNTHGTYQARAFLSDAYRPIDNFDVANAVLPIISEKKDLVVRSAMVTEKNLFIKVVSRDVQGDIMVGDTVAAGFCIKNSEVGCGAFSVESFVERLRCTNGMRGESLLRKTHTGSRFNLDEVAASYEILSSDTRRKTDEALFAQVQDITRASLSYEYFDKYLTVARKAAGVPLLDAPQKVVEITKKNYSLAEDEKDSILVHLIKGGDLTKWGLANAVTRLAEDTESYDRASELEHIGYKIMAEAA